MRKRIALFILFTAVLVILTGCGTTSENSSSGTSSWGGGGSSGTSSGGGGGSSGTSSGGGGSSEPTAGQRNALQSAEQYLSTQAFSRTGLIRQLSSKWGDGYSKADATWAVNHVKVNWKEQAYKAAKQYLDTMPFSRSGLIEQLESSYGDGFTHAQAVYGVNKAL
jgi:hypothetical protein